MPSFRSPLPSPERRSRTDIIATAVIVAGLALGGAGVWLGSDAHSVQHHVADGEPKEIATSSEELPRDVRRLWTAKTQGEDLVADRGGVVAIEGTKVKMLEMNSGQQRWSYDKGEDVCTVMRGWDKTTMVFRGPKGCGQAVSLDSSTGQYWSTRDALAPDEVNAINGEDIIGTVSGSRVELWRSDLVRTVEVGKPFTPVKVGKQEYTKCTFTSAATAGHLLATMQACPKKNGRDDDGANSATHKAESGKKIVRLLNTTPEDSDAPETWHTFRVPAGSELVAASEYRAAIAIPPQEKKAGRIQVLSKEGDFHNFSVDVGTEIPDRASRNNTALYRPQVVRTKAMTGWFNGRALVALNPETLRPMWSLPDALGAGVAVRDKVAVPIRNKGIAIVNPATGKVERTIAVDRGGYEGSVELAFSGHTFMEKRGDQLIGLGTT